MKLSDDAKFRLLAIAMLCAMLFLFWAIVRFPQPVQACESSASDSNETYFSAAEPVANFIRGGVPKKKKCK